ncbi:MAG TPA: GNAT family N-acetyltransferase [Kineosporiaceae bacterium]|nr:GNAT family N-acetyltransferase [Kineosporiaceae bacterium]
MPRHDSLETSRLLLRRWQDGDREPFAAMNADPEVMRYFTAPLSRRESDRFVDRIEAVFGERGVGLWALEVRETGLFIGFTGLWPMPADAPGAGGTEIGWRLARHAWGAGYATEAARVVVDLAFGPLDLPELYSMTALANERSQAVMRRLGFTRFADHANPALPPEHRLHAQVVYRLRRPAVVNR